MNDKSELLNINDLIDKYHALDLQERYNVLWRALDQMQIHNGRSKIECIALAMGYKEVESGLWK